MNIILTSIKHLDNLPRMKYNYLILIMFVVVILIKTDTKTIVDFVNSLKVKLSFEDDYVT